LFIERFNDVDIRKAISQSELFIFIIPCISRGYHVFQGLRVIETA